MAHVRIEMDRGIGWEVRQEGDVPGITAEALAAKLADYAIQYPHRAFLDNALVAEALPKGRRGDRR